MEPLSEKGKLICEGIDKMRTLQFVYNAKMRVVEPQVYGVGKKGSEQMRGYQVNETPRLERLFDVEKMEGLQLLEERFHKPGPHYNADDSAFRVRICWLR